MSKHFYNNKEELIEGFRQGKEDAFDAIFTELYPALCYYAASIVDDKVVAQDIAEEAMIKVWRMRENFTHFLRLRSFLYTDVRYACINLLRLKKTRLKAQRLAPVPDQYDKARIEQLITAETYRELHAAIKKLPKRCREIISLYYEQGLSGNQIADKLNLAPSSVRSQKQRGIMLLQKRLKYFLNFFV